MEIFVELLRFDKNRDFKISEEMAASLLLMGGISSSSVKWKYKTELSGPGIWTKKYISI